MTSDSAPGFLVPDDLENSLVPGGRVAAFPSPKQRPAAGEGLISRDPVMLAVVQRAQRIARSDASVLVQGESGTGKEVIARYIHRNSPRASGPFVAVNCAAIPEQLLESELFGHERGAFSGALGQRIGKLEAAQNGTILLDEISEMDRRLQAKLLRALQEREIDRIGGRAPIKLNVRIIATSNRDLEQEVARQTFREDLYFRLNVVAVHMPRLRDRPADIPALAEHFVEKYRAESGRGPRQMSPAAMAALVAHVWPGNVRELENTVHRALVLTTDAVIGVKALEIGPASNWSPRAEAGLPPDFFPVPDIDDAGQGVMGSAGGSRTRSGADGSIQTDGDRGTRADADGVTRPEAYSAVLRSETARIAAAFIGRPLHLMERDVIIGTLQLTGGNRTRTAAMLGLSIRALRNKISLYSAQGIDVPPSNAVRVAATGITAASTS